MSSNLEFEAWWKRLKPGMKVRVKTLEQLKKLPSFRGIDKDGDLKFEGLISPHLYGEPLSDPRMLEWSKHIKKSLNNCRLKIVTNGDFLNENNY